MQKNLLRVFIIMGLIGGITMALAVVAGKYLRPMEGIIPVAESEVLPALTLKNMSDEDVELLKAHPGKTLLVNYWATWCPPCISEIPSLMRIKAERQSDTFDLVFISLDFPKDAKELKTLMGRSNLKGIDTLYMTDARQWSSLGGRGLPITVLVSPEGKIISRMVGAMDWSGPAGTDFLKNVP